MRLTPNASNNMAITSSIMVMSKAPIRYTTQSGVVGIWVGGGAGGSIAGVGVGNTDGAGNRGVIGTGTIIGGATGDVTGEVGGGSVVKVPTALQAL